MDLRLNGAGEDTREDLEVLKTQEEKNDVICIDSQKSLFAAVNYFDYQLITTIILL